MELSRHTFPCAYVERVGVLEKILTVGWMTVESQHERGIGVWLVLFEERFILPGSVKELEFAVERCSVSASISTSYSGHRFPAEREHFELFKISFFLTFRCLVSSCEKIASCHRKNFLVQTALKNKALDKNTAITKQEARNSRHQKRLGTLHGS